MLKLRFAVLISFVLLVNCCTSVKKINNTKEINSLNYLFNNEVKLGEIFEIKLKNQSEDTIIIHNPYLKSIERYENNEWRKLRILLCPCNANCTKPPAYMNLTQDKEYSIRWDLNEQWCLPKDKKGFKETITKKAVVGRYRVKLDLTLNNKREIVYKEFKIVE